MIHKVAVMIWISSCHHVSLVAVDCRSQQTKRTPLYKEIIVFLVPSAKNQPEFCTNQHLTETVIFVIILHWYSGESLQYAVHCTGTGCEENEITKNNWIYYADDTRSVVALTMQSSVFISSTLRSVIIIRSICSRLQMAKVHSHL